MKSLFSFLLSLFATITIAQNFNFKKYPFTWPNEKPDVNKQTTAFDKEDLVVIDEAVEFSFIEGFEQLLTKTCILKVNNEKGIKKISTVVLPESFDESYDKWLIQQGVQVNTDAPFIYDFRINYFAARILKKNGMVVNCNPSITTKKVFWVDGDGQHLSDYNYYFSLDGLEVGDIIEYRYEVRFVGRYGFNTFYFNNSVAKQNSKYTINYSHVENFEHYDVICNSNIADTSFSFTSKFIKGGREKVSSYVYVFKKLAPVNYAVNACVGKTLPHVFVDQDFLTFLGLSTHLPDEAIINADRGAQFQWPVLGSVYEEEPSYDKQHANIRKFLSKITVNGTQDTLRAFLLKLTDTLNCLQFVSAEAMHYSENAQYTVNSSEWLMKGKIIEEFMYDIYWLLLNEKKLSKNVICVQDKRLGEINFNYRGEPKYENLLFGISDGKSLLMLMPRLGGAKYHLDEIPFYYEGVNAALLNFGGVAMTNNTSSSLQSIFKQLKLVSFIKTSSSNENENVRTENGMFKINMDSSYINASIKENLNGQFSTIVRPLYLKDVIDSTVNPVYFKKCVDKPHSFNSSIKLTSKSNVFPFKYSFTCTEKIKLSSKSEISLKDWFSFTFNKNIVSEQPNFDYYFDFQYSDIYNYMLDFGKPTEILNASDFTRSIQNQYFELSSKLIKQTDSSYLLSVMVKVKESMLPKVEGQGLVDFSNNLNELNNLTLKLKQ